MPARGEEAWDVVYCKQAEGHTPAIDFLDGCPIKLQARFDAVLDDVAAAPPPRYSGGGRWEAMHGGMGGFHEVRLRGAESRAVPAVLHPRQWLAAATERARLDATSNRGDHRHAQALHDGLRRGPTAKAHQDIAPEAVGSAMWSLE
jgi:hypothetical protein